MQGMRVCCYGISPIKPWTRTIARSHLQAALAGTARVAADAADAGAGGAGGGAAAAAAAAAVASSSTMQAD